MFQKHYSDETLLSYQDGELPNRTINAIQQHLDLCWPCRARLAEIENQVHKVISVFEGHDLPGAGWVAESTIRFSYWQERFERNLASAPRRSWLGSLFPRRVTLIASAFLAGLVVLGVWHFFRSSPPSVSETISRTREAESDFFQKAIHQAFRIELVQTRPLISRHTSRLEAYSESNGKRYSARWKELDGSLKYGAWRAASDREYLYDPTVAAGVMKPRGAPARILSCAELADYGLDPQQLEIGFLRWLQSRRWRPVSFVSDFSWLLSQDGVSAGVERFLSPEGKPMLRLTAQRRTARLTAELMIVLDANNYRPQLQKIRFETPEQVVELRLIAERSEIIPQDSVVPAVFELDMNLVEQSRPQPSWAPPVAPPKALPLPKLARSLLLEAEELAANQIALESALHRVGACLEPVEIVRERQGKLLVRGTVTTEERKEELLVTLRELGNPGWLKVNLQTSGNADASMGSLDDPAQSRVKKDSGQAALSSPDSVQPSDGRFLIEGYLEQYLKRQIPGERGEAGQTRLRQRTAQFAFDAVSLSQEALRQGWALRRLVESYGTRSLEEWPVNSRGVLETMLQDHVRELQTQAHLTRTLLEPVFVDIRATIESPSVRRETSAAKSSDVTPGDWRGAVMQAFHATERLYLRVLDLFSAKPLTPAPDSDLSPGTAAQAESAGEAMTQFLDALPRMEANLRELEETVARGFSARTSVTSKAPSE